MILAVRSRALRARGLRSISAALARIAGPTWSSMTP